MIDKLVYRLIGTPSERRIKTLRPWLEAANALAPEVEKLPDSAFPERTEAFRARLREALAALPEGTPEEEVRKAEEAELDLILPEAFALAREAAKRAIGLRHFDVQLLGGM